MPHMIYLHGFLSSPASVKAQQALAYFEQNAPHITCHFPTLPGYPHEAVGVIDEVINGIFRDVDNNSVETPLRFVGSSMGGYLSTYFVEKYGGKAVIINPAVTPYDLLEDYMGEHINPNTNEVFEVSPKQIQELRDLDTPVIAHPQSYKVLLQTHDETLDYRLAERKYQGADMVIEQGGNHSFVDFENHLPAIYQFLFVD